MRTPDRRAAAGVATGLVLLATLSAGAAAAAPARLATAAPVKPSQELAVLLRDENVSSRPDPRSAAVGRLSARRPITHGPTVLPVIGKATDPSGAVWLRVGVPGRPNGRTGWVRRSSTVGTTTSWHIVVATASRRVTIYRAGRVVRAFSAVVGRPSTPTPRGTFFIEESVRLRTGDVGAPFALALSARSTVLQSYAGGPGQIALHGLANVGGTLGSAVSHGCVRIDGGAMRWLAARVGPGTPITITG